MLVFQFPCYFRDCRGRLSGNYHKASSLAIQLGFLSPHDVEFAGRGLPGLLGFETQLRVFPTFGIHDLRVLEVNFGRRVETQGSRLRDLGIGSDCCLPPDLQ